MNQGFLNKKLEQWHRVSSKNLARAEELAKAIGSPLEIMTSEIHYMTDTERARHHKLQQIFNKLNQFERICAKERILQKRKDRKKAC